MSVQKQIVFIGLPGSGKTSVGRLVAGRLGRSFSDADQEISRQVGMNIPEIFSAHGEEYFRDLEVEVITKLLRDDIGVIALGGGALTREETAAALADKEVVFLDVSPVVAGARVGEESGRPLLEGSENPRKRIAKLEQQRRAGYLAAATLSVPADGSLSEVATAVIRGLKLEETRPVSRYDLKSLGTLPVKTSEKIRMIPVTSGSGYQISVGESLSSQICQMLQERPRKVFLICPAPLEKEARQLAQALTQTGQVIKVFPHPDGEAAKNIRVVEDAWRILGENHFSREDAIMSLGGGATTDMGGFVAATWLRGIELINVPTSLLAMVDAAVGGKTGINTSLGKNLVGSFYPPSAVICDLAYLRTLPRRQLSTGLAEVIKCGFIADHQILELLDKASAQNLLASPSVLEEVISRAIQVKAVVVSQDLRESGLRECLNYGHTLAHAIEKASGYQVLHGEAVAIGMVFAAQVAVEMKLLDSAKMENQRRQIAALGLPTSCPQYSFDQLVKIMASDKKVRGGIIRMVLTTGDGQVCVVPISDYQVLRRAFHAINQCRGAGVSTGNPSSGMDKVG
ncbi:3-dehydroquinate synthase [Varibaculum vaginae]|uniref:3-dehydroquinate synthase n=1 Tax=Varibaculum vaginae TaxID=2364797 RepID=UPI000F07AED0|nr:3-dehydroquinate synthase [Varibaculum vaginae]